jgi:hypothetical protein
MRGFLHAFILPRENSSNRDRPNAVANPLTKIQISRVCNSPGYSMESCTACPRFSEISKSKTHSADLKSFEMKMAAGDGTVLPSSSPLGSKEMLNVKFEDMTKLPVG